MFTGIQSEIDTIEAGILHHTRGQKLQSSVQVGPKFTVNRNQNKRPKYLTNQLEYDPVINWYLHL